jgi:AraC-like DNA-binding protein
MPFVPLPFVAALLLAILLAVLIRRAGATAANRPVLALIGLCLVQAVLAGLRWGYGIEDVRFAMPVLAAATPPLVMACFAALSGGPGVRRPIAAWPYAVPPAVAGLLVAAAPGLIDPALIILYLGTAVLLLRLARGGPDALRFARLDGAVPAHRALALAAAWLAASAMLDIVLLFDAEWMRGVHAATAVGGAYLLVLLALGLCAAAAVPARPPAVAEAPGSPEPPSPAAPSDAAADDEVMARIDDLMRTRGLFRDPDLSLDRLARRAGLPARRISAAINRATGRNVSQWVNDHRIGEACRLLAETDRPVTAVLFDSGFQTKSNFNREFRRVTGMAPLAWRAAKSGVTVDSAVSARTAR